MRFKRCLRHPFEDTPRKRAALARKQAAERDALPLFADQIAAQQASADQIMAARAEASEAQEARDRSARARAWRDARQQIRALPRKTRRAMRTAWACAPYPGDPSRLMGMIRAFERGTLDPARPPFPLEPTDGSGARISDIRDTSEDWRFLSILKCRDIAEDPDPHSIALRRAAYTHPQAAADANRDKARAMQDRALAARLWLRMGALDRAPRAR